MKILLTIALISFVAAACNAVSSDNITQKSTPQQTHKVVLLDEVEWGQLNPARGDQSPSTGTLWGDRIESGPSGFLLKFVDGFKSPPHIHNVSYRGVVISGLIHNDDPNADDMWMPAGSFWTQPKGGVHITAAKGSDTLAYIEIEDGPYLVLPPEKEFQTKERPINVDASNIVWIDQPEIPVSADGAKVAFLWGNPQDGQLNGSLVKLPAGFTGIMHSQGTTFNSVVIQGRPQYQVPGETDLKTLEPGSYLGSKEESVHNVWCPEEADCIIYVRTDGKFNVIPAQLKR